MCVKTAGSISRALSLRVAHTNAPFDTNYRSPLMSYEATVYKVLIASPGDVAEERSVVSAAIYTWNTQHSEPTGAVLLPVGWETHAVPEVGDRPQAIINRQLVESADILIGVFWTRLGTHTGVAESGTAEEIEQFRAKGKPVLLYFSSRPVVLESVDLDEYKRLKAYKEEAYKDALADEFNSVEDLGDKVGRHLLGVVRQIHESKSAIPAVAAKRDDGRFVEQDRRLRGRLKEVLPTDAVRSLATWDYAGSFREDLVDDLRRFSHTFNDPALEFMDSELEQLRAQLMQRARSFLAELARNTWSHEVHDDVRSVPPEWEYNQPERFEKVVGTLNELSAEIGRTYAELIRIGRRKVGDPD